MSDLRYLMEQIQMLELAELRRLRDLLNERLRDEPDPDIGSARTTPPKTGIWRGRRSSRRRRPVIRVVLIGVYLAAIITANLSIAHWGPKAAIYNAFLFIGLDLTTRDRLHDLWKGIVFRNMAILIAVGGLLSWLLALWLTSDELNVARIAMASTVSFMAAAGADAIAYHFLRKRPWYERANQSNIVGAAVDSAIFLPLSGAPGVTFAILFTQFCAKVAGGVVWSFVLRMSFARSRS